MTTIKSAAIIGAGALGLLYAGMMKEKLGDNCFFLADSLRFEQIKDGRFIINDRDEKFSVRNPEAVNSGEASPPDLILIAVKNHHLETITDLIKGIVTEKTIIISVLNGIDSETFLQQHFPEARIISTVAVGMDAVKNGRSLNYTSPGKLLIGLNSNDKTDPVLINLAAFIDSCGISYEIPDDIQRSLWWKWMINIGVNQVSAVTGANYGVFHTDRDIQLLMESAMKETIEVARAAGVDLREEDITNWYPILNSLGAEGKTSMLQDVEAGRRTEARWFSGRLIELGRKYGVAVPVNETLYRIISTKERLYSRKDR